MPNTISFQRTGTMYRFACIVVAILLLFDQRTSASPLAQLVFWSDRDRPITGDVFIMNVDGSGLRNLTGTLQYGSLTPAATLDGKRIAFAHSPQDTRRAVFAMNLEDGSMEQLVDLIYSIRPSWSPDGTRLAFVAESDVGFEEGSRESPIIEAVDIFVLNLVDKSIFNLTKQPARFYYPSWSPDGTRIAYHHQSPLSEELGDIWVVDTEGKNRLQLTHDGMAIGRPSWSPDGRRLAYASHTSGVDQIWLMNADGSNQINISHGRKSEREPSWSPDGKKIVFNGWREGGSDLWLMNADGTSPINLTHHQAKYFDITWIDGRTDTAVQPTTWGTMKGSP